MEKLGIDTSVVLGTRIKFLALGSAAGRVLNYFFSQKPYTADTCLVVDTDLRCLESFESQLPKYCFAKTLLRGLSAGGDDTIVKTAYVNESSVFQTFFYFMDILVVIAGLGGGTGYGLLRNVIQTAIQSGSFVLVVPILPFSFEGKSKGIRAQTQLKTLHTTADLVVPFHNDLLFQTLPDSATIKEAFQAGNLLLCQLLQSLCSSLSQVEPDEFACSLSDFTKHFSNKPDNVYWGYGEAEGENAVQMALQKALEWPKVGVQPEGPLHQKAFIYTHLTSDIPLTALKNLNYDLQGLLGIPELQALNVCHTQLTGKQSAKIFVLISCNKRDIKTIRYRNKKAKKENNSQQQMQFDFEEMGAESYWDTPTYLRLGLKLES